MISNFSAHEVKATATWTAADGSVLGATALTLAPFEIHRIDFGDAARQSRFQGAFGGIEVGVDRDAGAVDVANIAFDETTEMSAIMRAFGVNPAPEPQLVTLRAPLIGLAKPDAMLGYPAGTALQPQIFIRNASNRVLMAQLGLNWRSAKAAGKAPIAALSFKPGETAAIDLAAMQRGGSMPADANWASAALSYSGREGELVPIAASYDASGRYGLQSPFKSDLSFMYKGGMWHVDTVHDSLLAVGNAGADAANVSITLHYGDRGHYDLPERHLAPGEETWIQIGPSIRNQVPDRNGKFLPPDVTSGSYEIRDLAHPNFGYLYEGEVVTDETFGSSAYGCAGCCIFLGPWLEPGSYSGQVGATEGFTVWTNNDCSGQDVQVGSTQWSSSNTGVATVSLVNGAGNVSCIAPGSATISAFVRLEEGGTWPKCTLQGFNPGAGVLVETPIQHNYPNRPFSNACRISQFFDHIGANGKKHDAQDVVLDNGKGAGSTPALGTPVYAVESGKVVVVVSGNGPASQPFPQCQGVGSAGNYVKVQNTTDKYFTVYFHVKPIVTVGQTVTVGQEIGTIDNSGCQSGPHLHVARKDPNGNPVNFTLPCVNPTPTNNFWDGLVDDDVPDTI